MRGCDIVEASSSSFAGDESGGDLNALDHDAPLIGEPLLVHGRRAIRAYGLVEGAINLRPQLVNGADLAFDTCSIGWGPAPLLDQGIPGGMHPTALPDGSEEGRLDRSDESRMGTADDEPDPGQATGGQ